MDKDKQFALWESEAFGAGYGTGEAPILRDLKKLLSLFNGDGTYDHEVLERGVGESVAWLLINALSKVWAIEWGTSARFGWLTPSGRLVSEYVSEKSLDELYVVATDIRDDMCVCNGKMHGECENPMLSRR